MKRHIVTSVVKESKLSLKALVEPLLRSRKSALSRRQLLALNDRLLRDIGLTRYEVLHSAAFHSEAARDRE
jgi:uncharacterized protein YjiS (DUF1127 family)